MITSANSSAEYQFTEDWFSSTIPVWTEIFARFKPKHVLEIGSYEGRSAVWMIENLDREEPVSLCCIDTWQGSAEHKGISMSEVEQRFHHNIRMAREVRGQPMDIEVCKGLSHEQMTALLSKGKRGFFDLIYIDGSHKAPDVLRDLVLAFDLCAVGGVVIADDYLWFAGVPGKQDLLNMPKPAIDAFTNIYNRKICIFSAPLLQFYFQKISD